MNHQAEKVVVVAYRRWLFTKRSNCTALTVKILVFWIGRHLRGGHLREMVAHGVSTVSITVTAVFT